MIATLPDIYLKANLLSHGITISESVLSNYGYPFLEKRRAYGNQDPPEMRKKTIPQELYTTSKKLIVAVNVKLNSKWKLIFDEGKYYVTDEQLYWNEVTFPMRPEFYDRVLFKGERVDQVITLYGGSALGIFANGRCSLADMGKACSYCSLLANRTKETDFLDIIQPDHIRESLDIALQDYSVDIKQVMINGGNLSDLDKNFLYYIELAKIAEESINQANREVDLHLIVFPPNDLSLFEKIKDTKIGLIMNVEVFDPFLFQKYCPGKALVMGRDNILHALEEAARVLGKNRVFSVLVGGLESIGTLSKGLTYLAERDVTPIINILHTDPGTPLAHKSPPSVTDIINMGKILQNIYTEHNMKACYEDCGRNSIDTEAYRNLF